MKNITISKAIENFLNYMASLNRSENTIKTYHTVLSIFARFVESRYLAEHVGELKENMVEAWMMHMHRQDIMGSTRRTRIKVLKSFSKYLFLKKYAKQDIAYAIAMPRADKRKPVWVRDEKIREVLSYLLSNQHPRKDFWLNLRDHLLIRLLYVTGIRISEAMDIDPSKHVNWHEQSIEIFGKGKKQRTVYADASTLEILKIFLSEQAKRFPDGNRIFRTIDGTPLTYETLKWIVKKNLDVTPHVLRHSYATNLRLRGMDIDAIAELMGHESIETTRIYATLANEELRKRYNECGLLSFGTAPVSSTIPKAQESYAAMLDEGVEIRKITKKLGRKRPPN